MLGHKQSKWLVVAVLLMMVMTLTPNSTAWAQVETSRSSWLLGRSQSSDFALTGQRFEQSEIGGGSDGAIEFDSAEEIGRAHV